MRSLPRVVLLLLPVLFTTPANRDAVPGAFAHFPQVTFWAWQMPERFGFIDPQQVAVAYLDQTIYVYDRVRSEPRLQPLQVPSGTRMIAVVRIEMPVSAAQTEDARNAIVKAILRSAARSGISGLQIDFDAVKSQRTFYRKILAGVRARMSEHMPLSITALASWCGFDDWISGLPVDEAVPMLFRMGREGGLVGKGSASFIHEPLCSASLGLSTDEPWPKDVQGKRLYVFHVKPWTREISDKILERIPK